MRVCLRAVQAADLAGWVVGAVACVAVADWPPKRLELMS